MNGKNGWIWPVIVVLLIPLIFASFLYARSVEEQAAKQTDIQALHAIIVDVKQTVERNRLERNQELLRINDKLDALILQGKDKK